MLEKRRGGGLGPKSLCTKNDRIRFSQLYIPLFPTVVTLVWAGGGTGSLLRPLLGGGGG